MIDYVLPMAGNTACVITSESMRGDGRAFVKLSIVRTGVDLTGTTLLIYQTAVRADNYAAWNETVKILEQVARRVASYKKTRPDGLGYLDRAYIYLDDVKPELEKLRS